jgi:hypothetical protein
VMCHVTGPLNAFGGLTRGALIQIGVGPAVESGGEAEIAGR